MIGDPGSGSGCGSGSGSGSPSGTVPCCSSGMKEARQHSTSAASSRLAFIIRAMTEEKSEPAQTEEDPVNRRGGRLYTKWCTVESRRIWK